MQKEPYPQPVNGYLSIFIVLFVLGISIYLIAFIPTPIAKIIGIITILITGLLAKGFTIINPNESCILLLFGAYKGVIKTNGFYWVNPFYNRQIISLKARNFESERLKVNDKLGNPIMISAILVWKVQDTYKAMFEVENYSTFVKIQTDSAVRKLAGTYPYDQFESDKTNITLSSNFEEINKSLETEITERLKLAGITVIEARLGYLAYAPEIAQSMLKRQQATAIIAARTQMVEGAVNMVEDALKLLSDKKIIQLSEERKAHMVGNLLLILCSDKDISPVLNTENINP